MQTIGQILSMAGVAILIAAGQSIAGALPVPDSGFDWNRFYVGASAGGEVGSAGASYGAGVQLGLDARLEVVLAGAQIAARGLTGGTGSSAEIQGTGRVGLMLSDNLAVYGAGGAGFDLGAGKGPYALAGGGIEAAVTDSMSVDGRYLHAVPLNGAPSSEQLTIGTNFHF